MDWFLELADHHVDYSEINFVSPPGYTVRYTCITNEPSVGQSNWGQDDFYMAWIPELDGCMTQAKDQPEVIAMIQSAMKDYLDSFSEDGLTPPAPHSHIITSTAT